ncbi:MAG: DUF177 domain-containing protein [Actinobacteria bacterium]|nr:MAG: DUF177 domain-containing protein [Actinomycetota bacterium]
MRSPFLVNIADLAAGSDRRERTEARVDWALELSAADPDMPLVADLELHALTGGILVRGRARITVRHTCHRCLSEFTREHDVPVSAMFMTEPDDDSYELAGSEIDVEQMLRDEVLLAMPLLPRCGDDCPGVVSSPGTGLNTGASAEGDDHSGSPFAVLRDLLDRGT